MLGLLVRIENFYLYSGFDDYDNLNGNIVELMNDERFRMMDFIGHKIIKVFCGYFAFLLDDKNDLYILGVDVDDPLNKYLDEDRKLIKNKM